MRLPVIDEYHQDLRKIVQRISHICMSEEFLALKKELEIIYANCGAEHASILAFQDALYALIAQKELNFRQFKV
ncbi:MAG: hypothetical protein QHH75_02585 [Bacillota bacterium]|nr:hypothetical protein [Bacillota bacterium]